MARGNTYTIEISIRNQNRHQILFDDHVPYFGSSSFQDHFYITTSQIIIKANRSAVISLDRIFYDDTPIVRTGLSCF